MNTPQTMTQSSALSLGRVPSTTQSTTARATAAWAGPNICITCLLPFSVTLVIMTVAGLHGMFGQTTASRFVCPADWLDRALANATPDRPVLRPDHQVDVGDVVEVAAFNDQSFADVKWRTCCCSVVGVGVPWTDGVDGSRDKREGNRIPAAHPSNLRWFVMCK